MAVQEQKPESGSEAEKRDYPVWFSIAGAFLAVIFFLIVGMAIYPSGNNAWSYGINLFTSIISTIATVGIIEALNRQREKREVAERDEANRRRDAKNAEDARKQQLIDDAASNVNDVAKNAVYQMKRKGWLEGENGLLKGTDLRGANLQGAELWDANLQEAVLTSANLEGAELWDAKLQEAVLGWAYLERADLRRANLQGAKLLGANMHKANLDGANLQGANLQGAMFDERTMLPDGSRWALKTDMRRFTDPEHPDFWRSGYSGSPAYRGKDEV